MKLKKIIYIADSALGKKSAQATHNVEIAFELNKLMDITFLGGFYDGETLPEQLNHINNRFILKISSRIPVKITHFYYDFWIGLKFLQTILKNRNQIIYIRYRLTGSFLFLLFRIFRIKYIVEYNDHTIEQFRFMAKYGKAWSELGKKIRTNRFTLKLIELREKNIFNNAYYIRAITAELKKYIETLIDNKDKIKVIPNGTNPKRFYPLDRNQCRKDLDLDLNKNYGIHVGSLTPWDGVDYVINAIKNIDNFVFLIIGGGSDYKKHLQNLVRKIGVEHKVKFVGAVSQEMVRKYIGAADICFLLKTIISYGLSPIKYYEYMACGRPIVATNVAYINNVIKDKCGLVVNIPIKSNEITKVINKMLTENKLDEMGNNARKAAVEKYTWEKRAKEIYTLINKI
jgi:glycosyltransferase involved in cell wall biosynthesis